jgi:hypothetical protein
MDATTTVDAALNGLVTAPPSATNGHPVSADPVSLDAHMHVVQPESDARHEPAPDHPAITTLLPPIKVDRLDRASMVPEVGTPADPGACRVSVLRLALANAGT